MYKIGKRIIIFFCFNFVICFFCACNWLKSDDEINDELVEKLILAMENKDKDSFIKLFATNKANEDEDFEQSVNELFNYYDGEYQNKLKKGQCENKDKNGEFSTTWFELSYDVTTSTEIYRIALNYCSEYSTSKDNVGIWYIYIIKKSEDVNPNYTYWGDGLATPGINIGKKYSKLE